MRTRARLGLVVIALMAAATLLVLLLRPAAPRPDGSAASRGVEADGGAASVEGGVAPTEEPDGEKAAPPVGHTPDPPVPAKPADPTRGAVRGAAVTRSLNLFVEPIEPKGPVWIAPVTPDDHGRGMIRLARPGRYRLIVLRNGGGRQHATVELDAPPDGVSSPVRVTLED